MHCDTSLGEQRANLSAFRTFVQFALVWFCRFSLPLGVWEGLRLVTVALSGLFSYLFFALFNAAQKYSHDEPDLRQTLKDCHTP